MKDINIDLIIEELEDHVCCIKNREPEHRTESRYKRWWHELECAEIALAEARKIKNG